MSCRKEGEGNLSKSTKPGEDGFLEAGFADPLKAVSVGGHLSELPFQRGEAHPRFVLSGSDPYPRSENEPWVPNALVLAQGKTPWVDSACADHSGLSGFGCY